jgi:nitroreductase
MEFFEVLKKRRSIRAFKPEVPPRQKLDAILEAVRIAPSAGNVQAFRLKVVTEPPVRKALAKAAFGQDFVAQAPWVLAFMTDREASRTAYGARGAELYALQDATIACEHAHLAAAALGLGSVWVGAFSAAEVAGALGLPPELLPVAMLPIGLPAESPEPTSRKPIQEILI